MSATAKEQAVTRVLAGEPAALVARDLGLSPGGLRKWVERTRKRDSATPERDSATGATPERDTSAGVAVPPGGTVALERDTERDTQRDTERDTPERTNAANERDSATARQGERDSATGATPERDSATGDRDRGATPGTLHELLGIATQTAAYEPEEIVAEIRGLVKEPSHRVKERFGELHQDPAALQALAQAMGTVAREELVGALAALELREGLSLATKALKRRIRQMQRDLRKSEPREGGPVELVLSAETEADQLGGIEALQRDDEVFVRGDHLAAVLPEGRLHPLSPDALKGRIGAQVQCVRIDEDTGERRPVQPPIDLCRMIAARGRWEGIRELAGIVCEPRLRPDGSVLQEPGYDAETQLLYVEGETFDPVPAWGLEEAQGAAGEFMSLVGDFPFLHPEGTNATSAAWLAMLLTPIAVSALPRTAPTPFFLLEAPAAGTGKSKLAMVTATIAGGPAVQTLNIEQKDATEMGKLLVSIGSSPRLPRVVLFDNIKGQMGWAPFDLTLSLRTIAGRVLGQSRTLNVPSDITWFGTSNQATLTPDMARRTLTIRLDARTARPTERRGFRIEDIEGYATAHRARLMPRAMGILRAYLLAGAPRQTLEAGLGGYQAWSALVRGCVRWLGYDDPGLVIKDTMALDESQVRAELLIRGLLALFGTEDFGANEVHHRLSTDERRQHDQLRAVLCEGTYDRLPSHVVISRQLRGLRGVQLHDGLRFESWHCDHRKSFRFAVKRVTQSPCGSLRELAGASEENTRSETDGENYH